MNFDSGALKWPIAVGGPVWHKGFKQRIITADFVAKTVTIEDPETGDHDVIVVD